MQTLREMQSEDIDAVLAVIESQDEDDAEEAEAGYREIGGVLDQYVIEQDGKVIGVTGFSKPPGCDETYWLSWTYVHEDYANKGHGRKMLNELIELIKQKGGRKLFVKVSDYVDDEDGAIYAAALHLYQSLGFNVEITHKDYYDEGESQIILGLRLKDKLSTVAQEENCPVTFNSVFEIAETDDAYSFGWHDEGEQIFTEDDVKTGIDQVRQDEGRAVFLSFPSNFVGIKETLLSAGFSNSGILDDYYEDGVHEQHFTYIL
ncbi:MAG: GNAT family N-acetyltransferase [Cocleimonas sp.]|nr:GNAT family N-acetyltransferase [Cocleimonas sp.]